MLKETHLVVGIAATLTMLRPESLEITIPVTIAAACGSVICDIDSDMSGARRSADVFTSVSVLAFITLFIIEKILGISVSEKIMENQDLVIRILAAMGFLALCAVGKLISHRSFMHSLMAGILLSICLYLATSKLMAVSFFGGFLSHLALDLMNRKGIRILWPMKDFICLNLCDADGIINKALFITGAITAVQLFTECAG